MHRWRLSLKCPTENRWLLLVHARVRQLIEEDDHCALRTFVDKLRESWYPKIVFFESLGYYEIRGSGDKCAWMWMWMWLSLGGCISDD
jgi:hypothetical protein